MRFITTVSTCLTFGFVAVAQNIEVSESEDRPVSDEVQKAIDEFNRLKGERKEKANEVTVVLDPPEAPAPRAKEVEEEKQEEPSEPEESETSKKPVLINGKPPAESDDAGEDAESAKESAVEEEVPAVPEEDPGLQVQVQSIRKGSGEIDPKQIRLNASFPVKPLTEVPSGWKLKPAEDVPSFVREVELQAGTFIALDVKPHVLVPEADGLNHFSISEPGYEARNGYRQIGTVGAILGDSIAGLDEDSVKMGDALSELHRLLASLPKPEPSEETTEAP